MGIPLLIGLQSMAGVVSVDVRAGVTDASIMMSLEVQNNKLLLRAKRCYSCLLVEAVI